MQKSPINFRFGIYSFALAVSFFINGAAAFFFFYAQSNLHTKHKHHVISVDIVQNKKETDSRLATPKNNSLKTHIKSKIRKSKKVYTKKRIHKRVKKKIIFHTKKTAKQNHVHLAKSTKQTIHKNIESYAIPYKHAKTRPTHIHISSASYSGIFSWIAQHKFYPSTAIYKNEQGSVGLRFVIGKNGNIYGINIIRSSKYDSLDSAALETVQSSSPIPSSILNHSGISVFPVYATLNIRFTIQ